LEKCYGKGKVFNLGREENGRETVSSRCPEKFPTETTPGGNIVFGQQRKPFISFIHSFSKNLLMGRIWSRYIVGM
jgi:hypothetical protein